MKKKFNVGVVVGRFQVPELHPGHIQLFTEVEKLSTKLIVIVGSSHVVNTKRDPLDFRSREFMIREIFPSATVLGIKDKKEDKLWSDELDTLIASVTNPKDTIMLFGGRDSFIKHYSGIFQTTEVEATEYYSGSKSREDIWDRSLNSEKFRSGVIWAAYNRYPVVHPTVDIAIFSGDGKQILLGAKYEESLVNKWRLPGGFVDIDDKNFEMAARREVGEELGVNLGVADFKYLVDMKINDWRYRDQEEVKLHTVLFSAVHMFGTPSPGDDLFKAKWFDFDCNILTDVDIVDNHKILIEYLLTNRGIT